MGQAYELLLEVKDLKTYFFSREGTLRAVDGVSFDVHKGRVLGIAGESGCGKSVTSQSVLRIVPKNGRIVGGTIALHLPQHTVDITKLDDRGRDIKSIRGKEISMVFQEPMSSFSPVYTVGNQIMEVIRCHQDATKREARGLAIGMLEKVGMPDPARAVDAYPFELSGGMRQRAMIAMALSCRPKLLIADEPTSSLDVTVQAQILRLLEQLRGEFGMAVMLITHDLGVIAELADDVVIMYLGTTVEYGSVFDIFNEPKHPYTSGLLASIPKLLAKARKTLTPIPGNVPSIYRIPTGCPFHNRCLQAIHGVCERQAPPLVETGRGHHVRCHLYAGGGS